MDNSINEQFINNSYQTLQQRQKYLNDQILKSDEGKKYNLHLKEITLINGFLNSLQKLKQIKKKLDDLN